jgi:ABC-type dipeptide/oligopeptide/nickel transport system permease subunit
MTSLGQLAAEAAPKFRVYPFQMLLPSIIVSLIIFSFFMLGNCLRDALDPQLRDARGARGRNKRKNSGGGKAGVRNHG